MHRAMIPYAHEARAAMIYLHSTDDRQHKIADSLGRSGPGGSPGRPGTSLCPQRIWRARGKITR